MRTSPETDKALLEQRHRRQFTEVTAQAGHRALFFNTSGGFQGDSVMPQEFNQTYGPQVQKWIDKTATGTECAWLQNPVTSRLLKVHCATSNFADDLGRTCDGRNYLEITDKCKHHDQELGNCLGEIKTKVNHDKKEMIAKFVKQHVRQYMEQFVPPRQI